MCAELVICHHVIVVELFIVGTIISQPKNVQNLNYIQSTLPMSNDYIGQKGDHFLSCSSLTLFQCDTIKMSVCVMILDGRIRELLSCRTCRSKHPFVLFPVLPWKLIPGCELYRVLIHSGYPFILV